MWPLAPRLRVTAVTVLALLLFGVVSWSIVRSPEPDPAPLQPPVEDARTDPGELGVLIIDALPWARVTRLQAGDGKEVTVQGDRFTPFPIELPVGRYTVELSQPGRQEVETCVVEVTASSTARCGPRVARLEVDEFFKETGWWQ